MLIEMADFIKELEEFKINDIEKRMMQICFDKLVNANSSLYELSQPALESAYQIFEWGWISRSLFAE
jgi:hypothetical protein